MRRPYDLYDQPVGASYQYLLQYREDNNLYTGDGIQFPIQSYILSNTIQEEFEVGQDVSYVFNLQDTPNPDKPITVIWNGLRLRQGLENDFVIAGDILQINPEHLLAEGDYFQISYTIY